MDPPDGPYGFQTFPKQIPRLRHVQWNERDAGEDLHAANQGNAPRRRWTRFLPVEKKPTKG